MAESLCILNVDDNSGARYIKSRMLLRAGHKVLEAASGDEALEILGEDEAQVAVLDVKLPDITGHELARRIRGDPKTAHIPVVEVSAVCVSDDDERRALESGADAFLRFPVEPIVLTTVVETVARLGGGQALRSRRSRQLAEQMRETAVGVVHCDLSGFITKVNMRATEILGRDATALCRLTWHDLHHPADAGRARERFAELTRGGGAGDFRIEARYLRPDGEVVWAESMVSLVRSGSNVVRGAVIAIADVSDQREAEH